MLTARSEQPRPPRRPRVGVLLDEATRAAMRPEWREVDPGRLDIDLLVIGSSRARRVRPWPARGRLPRPVPEDLVAACRRAGIPTALWDTERLDAPLVAGADACDHVYAADPRRVERYRHEAGVGRVSVLPPAVQPRTHNPVRGPDEPRAAGPLVLSAGGRGARGRTAASYRRHGAAVVPHDADVPVTARAALECSASGTAVLVVGERATVPLAPGEVDCPPPEDAPVALRGLLRSAELRDRLTHRAQRRIWREHTAGHRARVLLADAGLPVPQDEGREVTALVSTGRPRQLDHVLRSVAAQRDVRVQLALLAHGFVPDAAEVRARCRSLGIEDLVLLSADSDVPLGTCLDRLVRAADAGVVAKIDDDDLYAPDYLADQLHALAYSGAQVVGKRAHHVYLADLDATVLRFGDWEHRWSDLVAGPTIVCRRDVALAAPFPPVRSGEDTGFLRGALDAGCRVYSADRFGFVQVRSAGASHTWRASDRRLLAHGEVVFFGRPERHVFV
ncbi:glycosyltransferase [Cellulosimicrobium cellulans]|uniref:glycosyltransferase n=1 Tax=Cellulosimicrobium cellulans TaxID=1710 RepID=UPI0021CB8497|nr:glycosyltransferase [Cellulosimicrobium cellulans]